jgi:hypothetical protein
MAILSAPVSAAASSLANSLHRLDKTALSALMPSLNRAGVVLPPMAASDDGGTSVAQPPAIATTPPAKDLIALAITTLTRAIDRFGPVRENINKRIKRGQRLNRGSAALTVVLSSSAFGTLQFGGEKTWSTVLGLLALAASLLTLVASWAGDAKFADEFGEVSAKAENAISLLDRLKLYSNNPDAFPDWPDRVEEASELARYMLDKIARWSVGT